MSSPRYRALALAVGLLATLLIVPPALGWEPADDRGPLAREPAQEPVQEFGDGAATPQGQAPGPAGTDQAAGEPAPKDGTDADADIGLMDLGGSTPAAPPPATHAAPGKDDDIGIMDRPNNQPPAATGGSEPRPAAATDAWPLNVPDPNAPKEVDPEVADASARFDELSERLDGPLTAAELDALLGEVHTLMNSLEWKAVGAEDQPVDLDAMYVFWDLAALERQARMAKAVAEGQAAQAPLDAAQAQASRARQIAAIGSQLRSWERKRLDPPTVEQWGGLVKDIDKLKWLVAKDALPYTGDDWDSDEVSVDPAARGMWDKLRRYEQRAHAGAAKAQQAQDAVEPITLTHGPEVVIEVFPGGHRRRLAEELLQQGLRDWSPLPQDPLVTPPHEVDLHGLGLGNSIGPPHPPAHPQPEPLGQVPPFPLDPPSSETALQLAAGALGVWALTQVATALPCLPIAPPVGYAACLVSPIP